MSCSWVEFEADVPAVLRPFAQPARLFRWINGLPLRVVALVWVVLTAVFAGFRAQLSYMHLAGAPSFDVGTLTPSIGLLSDDGNAGVDQVLRTWSEWQIANPTLNGPQAVLNAFLVVDVVFPLLSAWLLGVTAWRVWLSRCETTGGESTALRQLASIAVIAPLFYLLSDYAENVALSFTVLAQPGWVGAVHVLGLVVVTLILARPLVFARVWWARLLALIPVAFGGLYIATYITTRGAGAPSDFQIWLLTIATHLKVATVAGILLAVVLVWIRTPWPEGTVERWWRAVLVSRGQLVALAPLLLLPVLPRVSPDLALQVQDVLIRSITERWFLLIVAVLATMLVFFVCSQVSVRSETHEPVSTLQSRLWLIIPVAIMAGFVVLAWLVPDYRAIWVPLAFAVLVLTVCIVGSRVFPAGPPAGDVPLLSPWWWLAATFGLGVVFGLAAWKEPDFRGLWLPLLVVTAIVVLLSAPSAVRNLPPSQTPIASDAITATKVARGVLVTIPFIIAMLSAGVAVALWQSGDTGSTTMAAVFGCVMLVVACVMATILPTYFGTTLTGGAFPRWLPIAGGVATATAVGISVWASGWPISFGADNGSMPVMLAGLSVLAIAFTWLVTASMLFPARGAIVLVRFRRVPLVALAFTVMLLARSFDADSPYHNVRVQPGAEVTADSLLEDPDRDDEPTTNRGPERDNAHIKQAFNQWNEGAQVVDGPDGSQPVKPMVFVAAAGGGIKAAFWTSLVLGCLQGPNEKLPSFRAGGQIPNCPEGTALPRQNVFLGSGISGGSLGLALDQSRHAVDGDTADPTLDAVLDGMLGEDYVAADLAAMFWRDVPNAAIRGGQWDDRAEVLEHAWEQAFARAAAPAVDESASPASLERGFYDQAGAITGELQFPLLLLNGASVDDRCRIAVSVLELAPADVQSTDSCSSSQSTVDTPTASGRILSRTKDVADYLCDDEDLNVSTAALLSARFPYVSPFGQLSRCDADRPSAFDVDGGLVESSGAGPLPEILRELAPLIATNNSEVGTTPPDDGAEPAVCIAPRLLLIDNGYSIPKPRSDPTAPGQLAAPNAFRAEDSIRSRAAQQETLETFERLFPALPCGGPPSPTPTPTPTTAVQIDLVGHPGLLAPLGWTLSRQTRAEMVDQINSSETRCGMVVVRSWFGPPPVGRDVCIEPDVPAPATTIDGRDLGIPAGTQLWFWTRVTATDAGTPRVVTVDAQGEFHLALSATTERNTVWYCMAPLASRKPARLAAPASFEAGFSVGYPTLDLLANTRQTIPLVSDDGTVRDELAAGRGTCDATSAP